MSEEVFEPAVEEIQLPTVLGALADPARLAVLRRLHEVGEAACGTLAITRQPRPEQVHGLPPPQGACARRG